MGADDVTDWLVQGEQLLKTVRYGAALATFEQALHYHPNSLQAAAGELKVFLRLKRYGKALTALQRAWRATASQQQQVGARGKNKGKHR
jgi:tetratricopeptide (TPR) repeat protein